MDIVIKQKVAHQKAWTSYGCKIYIKDVYRKIF